MIYVECNPDELLVKLLTEVSKREIIHAGNKPEVCKRLKKINGVIGLVDEDPDSVQPGYVSGRKEEIKEYENGIKVLEERNNKLIILCPRLEEFILDIAKKEKIDVKKYKLPDNGNEFHNIINVNLDNFEKLVGDLKKVKTMKTLRRLLTAKNN
jgi:hypothetical protein